MCIATSGNTVMERFELADHLESDDVMRSQSEKALTNQSDYITTELNRTKLVKTGLISLV